MPRIKSEESIILLARERRVAPSVVELFLRINPTYVQSEDNQKAILSYLRRNKLELSVASLNQAFQVLKIEKRITTQDSELPTATKVVYQDPIAIPTVSVPDATGHSEPHYEVKELTAAEIENMSEAERVWHWDHNKTNWIAALKEVQKPKNASETP